jgi:NAD(P)-dependent dehydrogenase (short-subunit alcohol dehydrogenase family)
VISARAKTAGVTPRTTVTVIGDGTVGLSAVLSAKRLGAERIILMGRHSDRTDLGREFGATDVVAERGLEGVERVKELTGGDGTHTVLECVGLEPASDGAGIVVASMAGHRESPYEPEVEHALATTPTDELLNLPFLTAEAIGTTVHAYALSKRANSLCVQTAAAAWGKRGARVDAISPGVIITPLALDELSGPRKDWFETVRQTCAAGRFATPDEVGDVAAFLLGEQAGFITGADLLMDGGVTSALRTGELIIAG